LTGIYDECYVSFGQSVHAARAESYKMKILTATISHESNSFSNIATGLNQFQESRLFAAEEAVAKLAGTNTVFGGFLDASRKYHFELVPLVYAAATPSGKVTREAFRTLLDKLVAGLREHGQADGLLLDLHGAMVSEDCDNPEGLILTEVRRTVGMALPVIAVLDLHANISETMRREASVLLGYDTYPHVDMQARGEEAGDLIVRLARKEVRPVSALVKPPMMPTSQNMSTNRDPMRTLLAMAHEAERNPRLLNVTVSGGFPPADVLDGGLSVLATADGDLELARQTAELIARKAWEMRSGFLGGAIGLEEAVDEAMKEHEGLITVVDIADNPDSGGPGDGPELVRILVEKGARNCAFCSIADPEVVNKAVEAGVGNRLSVFLGGKTDRLHGRPYFLNDAQVKTIADGRFINRGPMKTGIQEDIGRTVLLAVREVSIIVAEKRISPIDLGMFRMVDIEPTRMSIIGLKGKGHFRAAFEPISRRIILAEGPGITGSELGRLQFKNIRRPIFPLDPDVSYDATLRYP
jgi:microcystin degradation protein MlrC